MTHTEIVSFIWNVANLIRDSFKRGKYQDVILPLTVLRRLDCVLAPTKQQVLARMAALSERGWRTCAGSWRRPPASHSTTRRNTTSPSSWRMPLRWPRIFATTSRASAETCGRSWSGSTSTTRSASLRRRPPVPGAGAVPHPRPASRRGRQPHDGDDLRRTGPPVQRGARRESRGALHTPGCRLPHGGPDASG